MALPDRPLHAQPAGPAGELNDSSERIVTLTDGSIFRGELLEYVPRHHVTLRLASGQVRRFEWEQIKRAAIVRPTGQATLTPPPLPPPPIAAPPPAPVRAAPVRVTPPPPAPVRAASPPAPVRPALPPAPVRAAPPSPAPAASPAADFEIERDAAYHEHIRRAKVFYDDEQFTKALDELGAAYRLSPKPIVLYSMARAHHQLSHYREAYDLYQRYLAKDPNIPEQRRAQIEGYIAELTASAQQERVREMGPDPFAGPVEGNDQRYVYRRRTGMLVAGSILMPAAYTAALITGVLGLVGSTGLSGSYSNATLSTARWGLGTLLIPVAGPFISAAIVQDVTWSLPWVLVDGAAQVTGLALIIAGSQRRKVLRESTDVALLPYSSPGRAGLVLVGAF